VKNSVTSHAPSPSLNRGLSKYVHSSLKCSRQRVESNCTRFARQLDFNQSNSIRFTRKLNITKATRWCFNLGGVSLSFEQQVHP